VSPLDGLPADVVAALDRLRPVLPDGLYLAGGTAVAMRLAHRTSHDLDFFFHGDAVDIGELEETLVGIGSVVEFRGPGTLRSLVAATRVSFLQADLAGTQNRLEEPELLADVQVAGMKDLMAMKLKVLAERGELRDYYDVKCIDERGSVSLRSRPGQRRVAASRPCDGLPGRRRRRRVAADVKRRARGVVARSTGQVAAQPRHPVSPLRPESPVRPESRIHVGRARAGATSSDALADCHELRHHSVSHRACPIKERQ